MRLATLVRWLVIPAVPLLALIGPESARAHGDLHLRIAAVTQQIAAATNNPAPLYLARGELEREHADWKAASADYDRAAQLDPRLPGVDLSRAKLLSDSGQLESARAMFDLALRRSPADGECFVGRARVLVKLNQRRAAIADYRRGLSLLGEPQAAYFLELAQALVAEGQVAEALIVLDEGARKRGPILSLQAYAVELELGRKNTDAALLRIDGILAHVLRKESWLAQRGDIQRESGKPTDARKSYEAALAAIGRLPPPLQRSPSMVKLRERLNFAVAGSTNAWVSGRPK